VHDGLVEGVPARFDSSARRPERHRVTNIKGPLTDVGRKETGEALQASVVDMIDLSLTAKQLHWHVQGPRFRDVHLQLDTVVDLARKYTDILAERAVTIGYTIDGRAATIARETKIEPPATGFARDGAVVHEMSGVLQGVSERLQRRIDKTGDSDPVSQDQLIVAAEEIQEQSWWFQAMDA